MDQVAVVIMHTGIPCHGQIARHAGIALGGKISPQTFQGIETVVESLKNEVQVIQDLLNGRSSNENAISALGHRLPFAQLLPSDQDESVD
jgi:hypothetical protein